MGPTVVAGGDALKPGWVTEENTLLKRQLNKPSMIRASKLSSLKPFLASGVPKLQFDLLPAAIYCFDLEVDPKGGREGGVEGALLRKAEEDAGLAHPRVPYHEQLEEKVIVLGLIHPPKMGCTSLISLVT